MTPESLVSSKHGRAGRRASPATPVARLYPGVRNKDKDQKRLGSIEDFYVLLADKATDPAALGHDDAVTLVGKLKAKGKWPAKPDIKKWYGKKGSHWQNKAGEFLRAVTLPDDAELLTRHEVLEAPPDVLITNYSMLEYMLMRPLERPIFNHTRKWLQDNPDEKFLLIIDEAHLYRGAAGAEVALLLRRLRARLGIPPDRVQVIATSASFDDPEHARKFGAQLSGKDDADFRVVEGHYAWRDGASVGSDDDVAALTAASLPAFYGAQTDADKIAAVAPILEHRGATASETIGVTLDSALADFGPMSLLVNETMQKARPVDELGATLFPTAPPELADRAVSTLVALGSAARKTRRRGGAAPLPCARLLPRPARIVGLPRP